MLRSTDGSGSWHVRTSPAPQTLKEQLWLSALDGIVVGEHVARRTTDGGASWSTLPGVTDSQDFFNEVMQAVPGVFYAMADFHTAKTTNGGASWDWIFNPVFPVYRGKTIAFSADHLMMVTNLEGAEVWESTNGGVDWEERLQRFDLNGFSELLRRPDGAILTCSTEGDLFRSTDDGASWTNATHSPDDDPRVTIAAIEILPNGRAYAGSTQPGAPETNWHRSDDAGLTWFTPPTAPPVFNVTDVEFWDDANGLVAGGVDSMERTTDGGDTWTTAPLPQAIPGGLRAYQLSLPASGVAFCACDGERLARLPHDQFRRDLGAAFHGDSAVYSLARLGIVLEHLDGICIGRLDEPSARMEDDERRRLVGFARRASACPISCRRLTGSTRAPGSPRSTPPRRGFIAPRTAARIGRRSSRLRRCA